MRTASLLTILLFSARLALGLGVAPVEPEYRNSEILVQFRAGVTEEQIAALEWDFGLSRIHRFKGIGVCHYGLPVGLTVPEVLDLLSQEDWVASAEPNFLRARCSYDSPHTNQWYLKNTGQRANGTTGPPGNDISWPAAISKFAATTNSVIVAVVDTGVALNHEDLQANLWNNPSETLNGRDDDGNGLIDDLFGYDFINHDPLPYDELGHGSLVAGIIGAVSDNGRGIVGICPRARIMALRVLDQSGVGTVADIIPALDYARLKGAKIINCSFGGYGFSSSEQAAFAALRDAGILVVCAAGNGGDDGIGDNNDQVPIYPASYNLANMINVAAVDRTFGLASFSNFSTNSVQVGAPGTDMFSTDVTRNAVFEDDFQAGVSGWLSGGAAGGYRWEFLTTNANTYLSDGSWTAQNRDAEPYRPNTDTWMRSPQISLAKAIGSQLSFSANFDLADDQVWIETSNDTVNWTPIGYIYGTSSASWIRLSADLSFADGEDIYFRFRLISNQSLQGSGISIDDISISRVSDLSDGQSTQYAFNRGTSFAAPVVSGVAALAMAQRRDLTSAEVKDLILSNTRPVATLAGKVTTGGVVNADKMMTALPSVPVGRLAPVITANPKSQAVASGASASFDVAAVGPGPLYYQWLFNGQPISGATAASYTIARVQLGQAGNYAAAVTNSYGSVTSASAALTVDGTTAFGIIGAPFSYQITADNNPTGYSASGLPPGLRCDVATGVISGIPTQIGKFRVSVVARSIFSTVSATIVITIKEGSITSGTSADGIVGAPFSYQITADNNPTGYSASGLPPGLRCDVATGVISGTPTAGGTFSVRVEAKSIFSSASTTIVITITDGSIISGTSADAIVGVPFTYQIIADNNPTGYSASGLPPGFRCDSSSGVILGIPTGSGTFQAHVEARSIFGSASASILITIHEGAITSAASAEGIVGVPFTYQIAADNNPTGYSASGLPPGTRCDISGLISGTPTGTGTFPVDVEAKNIFGSASATVVITITQGSISGGTTPTLTISRAGNNVFLAWPASADGFILEEAQLQQNTWTNSSANVVIQGNQSVAVIPLQSTARFYRLRK